MALLEAEVDGDRLSDEEIITRLIQIRGIGNWLRHQYDRVDLDTVWHTATVEIVPLKASVKAALQQLQSATEPPNLG